MKKTLKNTGLLSMIVAGVMLTATTAQAGGESHDLKSWAWDAGENVNDAMVYPSFAVRRGEEGSARFRVTVDRDGNVLKAVNTSRAKSNFINSAATRLVKRLDLPALPSGYQGEKLTFALQLNYAIANSLSEERNLKREGFVTGSEVASNGSPLFASIQILSESSD